MALGTVSEFGFVSLAQWARILRASESIGFRRARHLIEAGVAKKLEVPHLSFSLLALTQLGCNAIGDSLPPVTRLRLSQVDHDLKVFDLSRALVERRGGIWISERRLRQRGEAGHIPDGVLRDGADDIAIEVELSSKAPRRLADILAEYAANLAYREVWYFTDSDEVARLLGRLADGYPMIRVIRFARKNSHG